MLGWVSLIGLDPGEYGTHSLRRTKATLICRRAKHQQTVQVSLSHIYRVIEVSELAVKLLSEL